MKLALIIFFSLNLLLCLIHLVEGSLWISSLNLAAACFIGFTFYATLDEGR